MPGLRNRKELESLLVFPNEPQECRSSFLSLPRPLVPLPWPWPWTPWPLLFFSLFPSFSSLFHPFLFFSHFFTFFALFLPFFSLSPFFLFPFFFACFSFSFFFSHFRPPYVAFPHLSSTLRNFFSRSGGRQVLAHQMGCSFQGLSRCSVADVRYKLSYQIFHVCELGVWSKRAPESVEFFFFGTWWFQKYNADVNGRR